MELKRLYEGVQDRIKVYENCIKVSKIVQKCTKLLNGIAFSRAALKFKSSFLIFLDSTKLIIVWTMTLREKCPNTGLFLVRIFRHVDWIRRDTASLFIQSECGKIRTRNNSVFGCFSRSARFDHTMIFFKLID